MVTALAVAGTLPDAVPEAESAEAVDGVLLIASERLSVRLA